MNTTFQFIDFRPRTGVEPAVLHLIEEIQQHIPKTANCKGVIKQSSAGFHFSIVLANKDYTLNTDNFVTMAEAPSRGRHWVIPVIHHMAYDIINQAQTWMLTEQDFN